MGVAAAQQSSGAAGPIVSRYQGSAAGGDSTASAAEGRVERSAKIAPRRAIPVEIHADGQHNRRLLRGEGGNLQNNKFFRYIILNSTMLIT